MFEFVFQIDIKSNTKYSFHIAADFICQNRKNSDHRCRNSASDWRRPFWSSIAVPILNSVWLKPLFMMHQFIKLI